MKRRPLAALFLSFAADQGAGVWIPPQFRADSWLNCLCRPCGVRGAIIGRRAGLGIEAFMQKLLGIAGLSIGALFLSSCVTTPYESAFNACEAEADRCYRICEDIPDERGYVQCQSHCDGAADRCFDQAADAYQNQYYGYGSYGYGSPYYGRYGSWYPNYGFYYDYSYFDRYGYRRQRAHPPGYQPPGYRPPGGYYQ
ncbi:MAG TPA: hypothetical protein DEA40_16545, partial [Parvularcula sp.]|nr:hypothetical protein [Parvularcula sp.]